MHHKIKSLYLKWQAECNFVSSFILSKQQQPIQHQPKHRGEKISSTSRKTDK